MLPLTGGVALGVMADLPYDEDGRTLGVGDTLFLYTDGISEAMNDEGEMFEEDRLKTVLLAGRANPVGEVIESVTLSVGEFVGEADQSDDITCVVVRYDG